jgi:hypothetical protein
MADITLLGTPVPLSQLLVALAVIVVGLRVLLNALPGKRPPIHEGIPFIGGLIKFSKVRLRWRGQWPVWAIA